MCIKFEDISKVRESIITNLQEENAKLKEDISTIKKSVDYNEQKSRNICLLIHGVPESDNDDTDELSLRVINNDVGVGLKIEDIERTHRIGPSKHIDVQSHVPLSSVLQACGKELKCTKIRKI